MIGIIATNARYKEPGAVILESTYCRYSDVGRPARIPGINPPYFSQFEYLDPVNGEIPWAPFFEARNIAMRARSILRANSRSVDDIQAIATDAAGLIDQYSDHENSRTE